MVRATRNGVLEMEFRGALSLVGNDGVELFKVGDTSRLVFPRSSLKLIQVLPILESGAADHFGFTLEDIALMCGSHNAEPRHVEAVRRILKRIDVPESALQCGPHPPLSTKAFRDLLRSGQEPEAVHNNCSGQHAGFLALARYWGAPIENYLDPAHPIQMRIKSLVSYFSGIPEANLVLGLDGCSAPNFAMPLYNLALTFRRLSYPVAEIPALEYARAKMVRAVTTHPFLVAGNDRYCTDLMMATRGNLIGKVGAAGIYCTALLYTYTGMAVKIDDGSEGPQYNIIQTALERLNYLPDEVKRMLEKYKLSPIVNCSGTQVGYRYPADEVFYALHSGLLV